MTSQPISVIIQQPEAFIKPQEPISLTIGSFDGLHLGHKAILKQMPGYKVILTFSNHPSKILHSTPISSLIQPAHKMRLLAQAGAKTILTLPFTQELSLQSPEQFLSNIHVHIPFSHLVLGYDAVIGHGRQGTPEIIRKIGSKLNFTVEYLPPVNYEGSPISSSRMRTSIQQGSLATTAALLGRPYSFFGPVISGAGKGKLLGFQTANISVEGLVLPPLGVYAVTALRGQKSYLGIANLGHAPTLHASRTPQLEVHLLNCDENLYGEELEVIPTRYIREEKRFETLAALKSQIKADISVVKEESVI